MMTFKQLEAIYWVTQLGGFSQAADKLHTTQSAIPKRVQELETLFNMPLFDRTQRTSRLTEKGEEMYVVAKKLLEQRDAAVNQFISSQEVVRRLRIGVTTQPVISDTAAVHPACSAAVHCAGLIAASSAKLAVPAPRRRWRTPGNCRPRSMVPRSIRCSGMAWARASTLTAAPPVTKLPSICAVTAWG